MIMLEKQLQEILKRFPELKLSKRVNDIVLAGVLNIDCYYEKLDERIIDKFNVQIIIPEAFPKKLPIVREVGKKIPLKYGHIYSDGELCLATDQEIRITLGYDINLYEWLDKFVIPYFYGYSYFEKYDVMPFGERSHGNKGVNEFYKEFFSVDTVEQVQEFFKYISSFKNYKYKGHHLCPCGSNKKIRDCKKEHSDMLKKCQEKEFRNVLLGFYKR